MTQSTISTSLNRRSFIKASALAGGGLMLGAFFPSSKLAAATSANSVFSPNFFIKITTEGLVTIVSKNPELGQGIKTSLPMIIAEEMEVPWEDVVVEQADYTPALAGWQGAGGSGAIPSHYDWFRKAGAVAREMLIEAAAQTWDVPANECEADQGFVKHTASKKKLAYKDLVAKASTLPVPEEDSIKLKDPKNFKILGKRIGGVDNHSIVTGESLFGIDEQHEGLLHAAFVRCPAFGGKVRIANLDAIKQMPGVSDVFTVEGNDNIFELQSGIAIVAIDTWSCFKAQQALQVIWDEGNVSEHNTLLYDQKAKELFETNGSTVRSDGDVATALQQSDHVVEADYQYPYLSHANLEPQNTTALYKDGKMEIWSPSQNPGSGHGLVAKLLGIAPENIVVHMKRMGGGFGRRLVSDFIAEAAFIAHKHEGTPIKVTWTREQDMKHDYYRAAGWHRLKGAVDSEGKISAWSNHFVTLGLNSTENEGRGAGLASDELPARFIPNIEIKKSILSSNVPMSWWRAPGSCALAWVFQSFIDELANKADRDTLDFRLELLGADRVVKSDGRGPDYDTKRMKDVLQIAAKNAGWGKSLPKGQGQGIAFHYSHRGYVAVVADVTVDKRGSLKVNKLTAGIDVGPVVNLSGAENQVQGSLLDALSAASNQEITIENGRVRQSNFDDNPLLRIADTPKIEIHFNETDNPPTGLGEPAFPPTAPAISNAIFAATGKRIRTLPFSKQDLSWS